MLKLGEINIALKYTKTVAQQKFFEEVFIFIKALKYIGSEYLLVYINGIELTAILTVYTSWSSIL